jgi:hypothetical protein
MVSSLVQSTDLIGEIIMNNDPISAILSELWSIFWPYIMAILAFVILTSCAIGAIAGLIYGTSL